MRGLDDVEMRAMDIIAAPEVIESDEVSLRTLNALRDRGLSAPDAEGVWRPTPLGRLALRIERAFRSGAALRGGV